MNLGLLNFFLITLFYSYQLFGDPLQKQYANFNLLDKISNQIDKISIRVNESGTIGTLNVRVYSCFTEPPNEMPEDYVLINVRDNFQYEEELIYQGWMISSSPDATPLEHPIYDLWLLGCSNDKTF